MIKISAPTLQDALLKAAKKLKCSCIDLDYEIIQHPRKGFLGLGKRNAEIVASLKEHLIAGAKTANPPHESATKIAESSGESGEKKSAGVKNSVGKNSVGGAREARKKSSANAANLANLGAANPSAANPRVANPVENGEAFGGFSAESFGESLGESSRTKDSHDSQDSRWAAARDSRDSRHQDSRDSRDFLASQDSRDFLDSPTQQRFHAAQDSHISPDSRGFLSAQDSPNPKDSHRAHAPANVSPAAHHSAANHARFSPQDSLYQASPTGELHDDLPWDSPQASQASNPKDSPRARTFGESSAASNAIFAAPHNAPFITPFSAPSNDPFAPQSQASHAPQISHASHASHAKAAPKISEKSEPHRRKYSIEEAIAEIESEINDLFALLPFKIDKIEVSKHDSDTILIFFKGEDSALLIGEKGYRYKAISYLLFNWINPKYGFGIRLEIERFLANQEEMMQNYLAPVIAAIKQSPSEYATKPFDGILVFIALKILRAACPERYIMVRTNEEGESYILIAQSR